VSRGSFVELVLKVRELGRWAKRAQKGEIRTRIKGDGTSVTQVDRELERKLTETIRSLFPEDGIIGEEGTAIEATCKERIWVIDPIDGTTNFRAGLPIWAISLALLHEGWPIWGCVYVPVMNWLFQGERGKGSKCNGKPISPLRRTHLHREDILGITSEGAKDWEFEVSPKIRALGSAAAQASFVAAGFYVGYFVEKWHIWDLAAAVLIAREAGVKVTDRRGKELDRFGHLGSEQGPPILFATPGVHRELLDGIRPKAHWRGKEYLD
jgi:myo-inositol-1(or 4)-monophosphatase